MLGVTAGYDSRPINPGDAYTGVRVSNKRRVFFQQLAFNAVAVSDSWNFNASPWFRLEIAAIS